MKNKKIKYILLVIGIVLIILGIVFFVRNFQEPAKKSEITQEDAIDLIVTDFSIKKENLEWVVTSSKFHSFYYKVSEDVTMRYDVDIKTGKIIESQYLGVIDVEKINK